ncbi:MAG: N5-glutamine methyltransferase family protein, partial [Nitrospirales bacterium]
MPMSTGTVREPVFLPQTVGHLLHRAVRTLRRAHIDHADQEAVWLLACALEQSRLHLLLDRARPVTSEASTRAEGLVRRRAAGEPLQYLLGTQEFCGLDFEVNPDVLIPRPETEVLVEETLRLVSGLTATAPAGPAGPVVVDLGTGSGCLAVALARALPTARLYATDQSCAALQTARRNAARHGVSHRITFCEGDLLVPLRAHQLTGRVSALVSNPPYIPE